MFNSFPDTLSRTNFGIENILQAEFNIALFKNISQYFPVVIVVCAIAEEVLLIFSRSAEIA